VAVWLYEVFTLSWYQYPITFPLLPDPVVGTLLGPGQLEGGDQVAK
jgi:hypothetical protein